jgi:hypothetical protein
MLHIYSKSYWIVMWKKTCGKILYDFFEWNALKKCDIMAKINLLEEILIPIYIAFKHQINQIIL